MYRKIIYNDFFLAQGIEPGPCNIVRLFQSQNEILLFVCVVCMYLCLCLRSSLTMLKVIISLASVSPETDIKI